MVYKHTAIGLIRRANNLAVGFHSADRRTWSLKWFLYYVFRDLRWPKLVMAELAKIKEGEK